ncbi:MAG TPA: hypothetical protein VE594_03885 [Nitrososphaeraceae archaeon]|jgi:hypothetical protein|nr:hypothetical protein [Nitrososphaeraceae archaeon]
MIRNKNRKTRIPEIPILLLIFVTLLVAPSSTQLIHNLEVFAYGPNQIVKILSEGGQICPLESECDKKKENQTDAHNMTLNIPGAANANNNQNSVGNSTTNNSNSSQNETIMANDTMPTVETNNSVQDMVDIKTDKQTYNPGEIVSIIITNKGSAELTFPNSALGLTIRNLGSNELYPILSSQVITILGPGDSKSLRWDQIGINGNQAPSGNYSASVNSDITTAQTTFSIK